jgi:hypothetical protein
MALATTKYEYSREMQGKGNPYFYIQILFPALKIDSNVALL